MKNYTTTYQNRFLGLSIFVLISCNFYSCEKYLDAKPDQTLTTPSTLNDLQAVLDTYAVMNYSYPNAGEISSDDYFLTDNSLSSISTDYLRDYYLWQKNDNTNIEWQPYGKIYYANIVLDNLEKISTGESQQAQRNSIEGSALFYRGFYFFSLSQIFAPVYDDKTASTDLGIPLRLGSDFNKPSTRSTVEETYDQIINDLQKSVKLLPDNTPYKIRPTKPAAYGLLARVYLLKQNYETAKLYADSCLLISNKLMDYNSLDTLSAVPIVQFNSEVIFDSRTLTALPLGVSMWNLDPDLYKSYSDNDIRKTIFFKKTGTGTFTHKGSYTGLNTGFAFTGIATDEIYLIRAECYARLGDLGKAQDDINLLLKNRMKNNGYIAISTNNISELLSEIIDERRKELIFRTIRWSDLRRLNKEAVFSKEPFRIYSGKKYELPVNSPRYVLQIPKLVIEQTGMSQNP